MPDHVLVPYDGSPQAEKALEHVCREHPDATVTLLHVIDPMEAGAAGEGRWLGGAEGWYERHREEAEALFSEAGERAAGVDLRTAVEVGRPARAIVEYADEHDADHVVMGSHGRSGVSRILLGSVAETVVRRSSVPVTVVR